jgi:hypothetical protein
LFISRSVTAKKTDISIRMPRFDIGKKQIYYPHIIWEQISFDIVVNNAFTKEGTFLSEEKGNRCERESVLCTEKREIIINGFVLCVPILLLPSHSVQFSDWTFE